MPHMGDTRLRARMMSLGSNLWRDTQMANYANADAVEQIAKDAAELAGLAKVFLVRVHDQRLPPYSGDRSQAIIDALVDNKNVSTHEALMNEYIRQAIERRNRA